VFKISFKDILAVLNFRLAGKNGAFLKEITNDWEEGWLDVYLMLLPVNL
jgi:hypothetical protein